MNSALPEGPAIAHAKTTHAAIGETAYLVAFLQARPSDRKHQVPLRPSDFPTLYLRMRGGVLVRQERTDGPLQKLVPDALRARIQYLSHCQTLARHRGE